MKLIVNDEEVEVGDGSTISGVLDQLGFPEKGIAVAVDWTVQPKSHWDQPLAAGSRVEVVTAVQGG